MSTPDARASFDYLDDTYHSFIRKHYKGNLMGCGDYNPVKVEEDIADVHFDLAVFGGPFISNPAFVAKCTGGGELVGYEDELLWKLV